MSEHRKWMENASRRRRFERTVEDVYQPLQRYARRRVDPHDVDDVVSETLLTLWRRIDDLPAGIALPWCLGVARRHIANLRRSRSRRLKLVDKLEAQPSHPPQAPDHLDPELQIAMDRLSDSDREILQLWAWEGLEASEIARVMDLTNNAASIRLHRAKKRLGENLEKARKVEAASGHSHHDNRKEARS